VAGTEAGHAGYADEPDLAHAQLAAPPAGSSGRPRGDPAATS
jgi:hypothetical protein